MSHEIERLKERIAQYETLKVNGQLHPNAAANLNNAKIQLAQLEKNMHDATETTKEQVAEARLFEAEERLKAAIAKRRQTKRGAGTLDTLRVLGVDYEIINTVAAELRTITQLAETRLRETSREMAEAADNFVDTKTKVRRFDDPEYRGERQAEMIAGIG